MEGDPSAHEPDDRSGQSFEWVEPETQNGEDPDIQVDDDAIVGHRSDPALGAQGERKRGQEWLEPHTSTGEDLFQSPPFGQQHVDQPGWGEGSVLAVWQDMLNDPVHRDQAAVMASDISVSASVEELATRWDTTPEGVWAWVEQVGRGMGWAGTASDQYAALRSVARQVLEGHSTLGSGQVDQSGSGQSANQIQGQLDDAVRDPQDFSGGLSWQEMLDHFGLSEQDLDPQAQLTGEAERPVPPGPRDEQPIGQGQFDWQGLDNEPDQQRQAPGGSDQGRPYLKASGREFPLTERQWQILTVLPRTRANLAETGRITVIDEVMVAKEVTEIGSWLNITGAAKAIAVELAERLRKREVTVPPHPNYSEVPSSGKVAFLRSGDTAILRAVIEAEGNTRGASRKLVAISHLSIERLLKTIGPDLGFADDDSSGFIARRLADLWKANALTISEEFIHRH